jgi:hypothetical protein
MWQEAELEKDLQYVAENMVEDPKTTQHRERMRSMHKDFYRVLRWQRKKLKASLGVADIENEGTQDAEWSSRCLSV